MTAAQLTVSRLARPHRRSLLGAAVWSLLLVVPTALSGRVVAGAVDSVLQRDSGAAGWWLAGLTVLGAAEVAVRATQGKATGYLAEDVRVDLTGIVFTGALTAAVEDQPSGVANPAAVSDQVESVRGGMRSLGQMLPDVAAMVAVIAGLASMDLVLAAAVAPYLLGAGLLLVAMRRRYTRVQGVAIEARQTVLGSATAALAGVRDVVACGALGTTARRVRAELDASRRAEVDQAVVSAGLNLGILALLRYLPILTMLAVAPNLVAEGRLSAGEVVGAITYIETGLGLAARFLAALLQLQVMLATNLDRLSVHQRSPRLRDRPAGAPHSMNLSCRRLGFRYAPDAEPIVQGLDLEITAGEHLAIVGPSGIGKSTVSGLLCGILEPTEGDVLLGGRRLVDFDDAVRSRYVAVVPQEAYVFGGSLRDNLRYLRPDAADEDLLCAARIVGLDRVLSRLGGLDAKVDTTTGGLSEGERQLIGLTRVFLSPARLVILDEATCYLDPVAEHQAEAAFAERGGTLVVVAHRMSSSLRAERVAVMDRPGTDVGTHQELLQRNRLYADMHGIWSGAATAPATAV